MILVGFPFDAWGQCVVTSDSLALPEVRIFAHVRASELRFATQPRAEAAAAGCVPADTVRVLMRTNIPEPVVAGVTYRDVEVAIEIVTRVSVVCLSVLRELLENVRSVPRLAALCALNAPPGGSRRP